MLAAAIVDARGPRGRRRRGVPRRHVHGVAAEHPEEGGELLDLGERVLRADVGHGRLEVDVEHVLEVLGGADVGVVDEPYRPVPVRPALDLGERDVAEGERREHLEEHRRAVGVVCEDDAGLERPVGARDDGLPRQHHEPRHVARVVLDAVGEHLEPVQLGGARRRDGGGVPEVPVGDVLGGPRRVVERLARHVEAHGVERELALRERLGMRDDAGEEVPPHPGEREEAVVDGELDLADDVEPVAEEEVVVAVDAAAEGVLDGEHGAVRDPEFHRLERHLELVAGDGVAARVRLGGGRLAVGARHALVGHAQLGAVHRRRAEVADAERAREVGDGDQIQLRWGRRWRRLLEGRSGSGRWRGLAVDSRRRVLAVVAGGGAGVGGAAGGGGGGGVAGEDGAGGQPVGAGEGVGGGAAGVGQ
ncbi:unnamed protein product [Urochloa decumbens]|uniref:Uncharacterized protein n=1 Tax=Urochloa decumbens TaxID=240449 RepID=A0ABC9G8N3_9POAL